MEHITKTIENTILSIIYSLEVGTYWIEIIDPYSLEVWNTQLWPLEKTSGKECEKHSRERRIYEDLPPMTSAKLTCSCVKQILTWPVSHIKWSGLIAMTSNDFRAMCGHIRLKRHVWCVTWATNQTTNGWWFSAFNHSILSNTLELGISPVKSAPQSSNISARVRAERKEPKTRSQTAAISGLLCRYVHESRIPPTHVHDWWFNPPTRNEVSPFQTVGCISVYPTLTTCDILVSKILSPKKNGGLNRQLPSGK